MPITALTFDHVPDGLQSLLKTHLPTSLPLLRRLQFARYKGLQPAAARTILVSECSSLENDTPPDQFTAVYIDYAGGPETQMWLYSTLEDDDGKGAGNEIYRQQLGELVQETVRLGKEYGKPTAYPDGVLLGTVNTHVRRVLEGMKRVKVRETVYHDKWLFKTSDLPEKDAGLPEGLQWDTATFEDCEVVVARTDVPRTPETLVQMPSLIIRTEDGTPISWAFLDHDGSLVSLHCEEAYRRRGLARTLAAKLMRTGPGDFADDGWSSADVALDNLGSRCMCKSLKGTPHWEVSWLIFNIAEEGYVESS